MDSRTTSTIRPVPIARNPSSIGKLPNWKSLRTNGLTIVTASMSANKGSTIAKALFGRLTALTSDELLVRFAKISATIAMTSPKNVKARTSSTAMWRLSATTKIAATNPKVKAPCRRLQAVRHQNIRDIRRLFLALSVSHLGLIF